MRTLIATLIALMLLATTPVAAGDFEDGQAAFKAGDYQKAVRHFKRSAEHGDALAQSHLGMIYSDGKGAPKDYSKAVHWYTKAAKQGHGEAQSRLGVMYSEGKGVPEDDVKAVYWLTKAAKQGLDVAQSNLGGMYRDGDGVPEDHALAYAWFSIAAARGHVIHKILKESIAKKMTPSQIAEGQKLSRELWEKHIVPLQKNSARQK
jgi:uncharacterized protein